MKLIITAVIVVLTFSYSLIAGDPIPGIDITLKNTETKEDLKTKTDKNGKFSIVPQTAGTYIFTLSVSGKSMSIGSKKGEEIVITGKKGKKKKPVKIVKEIDKASPKLAGAIKDWVIDTYEGKDVRKKASKDYNSSRSNTSSIAHDGDPDNDNDSPKSITPRKRKLSVEQMIKASQEVTVIVKGNKVSGSVMFTE